MDTPAPSDRGDVESKRREAEDEQYFREREKQLEALFKASEERVLAAIRRKAGR